MKATHSKIGEDRSRLTVIDFKGRARCIDAVCESLGADCVALIRNISGQEADDVMFGVSLKYGLDENLELQAGFATSLGHRHNIGQYFMSVNERTSYQFICAHSEGSSFSGMQLASFFCYENTTDGGVSILFNVNNSTDLWLSLREKVRRGKNTSSRTFASHEIARARGLYKLNLPEDLLKDDDEVLTEKETKIPNLVLVNALARPRKIFSRILRRDSFAYWDSVSSIDSDSYFEYLEVLRDCHLLREPSEGSLVGQMDNDFPRRLGHFGASYGQLFSCRVVHKLERGEMIVFNNITWAHSASNWSPGSGVRNLSASFA